MAQSNKSTPLQREAELEAGIAALGWTQTYPGRWSPPGSSLKFNVFDAWAMRERFESPTLEACPTPPAVPTPEIPPPAAVDPIQEVVAALEDLVRECDPGTLEEFGNSTVLAQAVERAKQILKKWSGTDADNSQDG